jgi:hypothetical protein
VADLRERFDEFCGARERAWLRYCSGGAAQLELARVHGEFADVSGGDALAALEQDAQGDRSGSRREATRRLWRGVQAAVVEARTLSLELEIAARERGWRARVDASERPLVAWLRSAPDDPERARREQVARALTRADEELAPLRGERRARRAAELERLGLATPQAWLDARLPDRSLAHWLQAARAVLDRTEVEYRDALARALAALGVTDRRPSALDLERAEGLPAWSGRFPAGSARAALDELLEGMGVRLDALGVEVDARERELRDPRARVAALRVPGELWISLAPRAGLPYWRDLFAQAGAALALAYSSPALPVERRRLGDPAAALAFGALLAGRLGDPAWLADGPLAPYADELLRDAALPRLLALRRACVEALAQAELAALPAGADVAELAGRWAQQVRDALGCEVAPVSHLRAVEELDDACAPLRAACLAVALCEQLRARHGRRFWRARAAGNLLKELWNTGTTYSAQELAEQLDLAPLDPEPLIRWARGG